MIKILNELFVFNELHLDFKLRKHIFNSINLPWKINVERLKLKSSYVFVHLCNEHAYSS